MYLHDWAEGSGNWKGTGLDGMKSDFEIGDKELEGVNILVASYTYESYEGSAYVLFERDGKLYEVHGGHCSCYGLEGQWDPEEAEIAAVRHRLENGTWGEENRIKETVLAVLNGYVAANDNRKAKEAA